MEAFLNHFVQIILRHPRRVLIVLALITIAIAPFVVRIPFVFDIADMFSTDDPTLAPIKRFRQLFGKDDNIVLLGWSDQNVYRPEGLARIDRISKLCQRMPGVSEVTSLTTVQDIVPDEGGFKVAPLVGEKDYVALDYDGLSRRLNEDPLWRNTLVGPDGDAAMVAIRLKHENNDGPGRERFFRELQEELNKQEGTYHVGGVPLIRTSFVRYMKRDQARFLPLTAIICTLLLYLLFRTVKPLGFSFVSVLLTLIWTIGFMALTGGSMNIVTTTLPTLLMVMGLAYSIHFMGRYIEESARQPDQKAAITVTLRHLAVAIFLTSFTTGVGFLSLLVMKVRLVRMYGIYSATGLIIAFAISITFLPVLCLLTKPIDKKAVDKFSGDLFRRYLLWNDRFVRKNHFAVAAVAFVLVGASVYGITKIQVNAGLMEEMNPKMPESIANRFFEEKLAGVLPLNIMIEAEEGAFKQPEMLRKLLQLRRYAGTLPVDNAISFADLITLMNQAMYDGDPGQREIPFFAEQDGGDERARKAVAQYLLLYEMSGDLEDIHQLVTPDFHAARVAMRVKDIGSQRFKPLQMKLQDKARQLFGDQVTINPVGESVLAGQVVEKLVSDMTKSLVLAAFIIAIVIFILMRSLRIGLLAMVPNLLPIMVSMSALGYFGVTLRTSIVMVFSIALGIAVDDTIHFLVRFQAEIKDGKNLPDAVTATFLGTGRAIVFTSVVLFAGFAVLTTSDFIPARNFGWLSALTMLTAMIGDLYLLPALMHIFRPLLEKKLQSDNANG